MHARKRVGTVPPYSNEDNEKKQSQHGYEFGGPIGAVSQMMSVPILVIAIVTSYEKTGCEFKKFRLHHISLDLESYYDLDAIKLVLGYFMFHCVIYAIPVGRTMTGPVTYSGKNVEYRFNAMLTLILSLATYAALVYWRYPVTIVYDKMLPIAAFSCLLSFVLNVLLHVKSYAAPDDELNPSAKTGNFIYDFFMGRELHPRIGKYFQFKLLIYRYVVTAWILIHLMYVQKEYDEFGSVKPSLLVVVTAQIFYCIAVFFWDEEQTIYSFDIKNEGLGFQNIIGNLAIVPFIYTNHSRYLIDHHNDPVVSFPILASAVVVLGVGLYLVIQSNYEKMEIRRNPHLSGVKTIEPTEKGNTRRLLISGVWGFVRHPNYLGEMLLGLGFGLVCGWSDFFPWFYFVFITGILGHRALRDEVRCKEAHGKAWDEYCRRVRCRILPYVF